MPRPSRPACALILVVLFLVVPLPALAAGVHGSVPHDQAAQRALDCERLEGTEAATALAGVPAPRIVLLHGSVPIVTMQPVAEFLIGMGYPEASLRDPYDGSLTRSSFGDSEELAGTLAWYYENDGMRPMLLGHSQGGMLVLRTLHELAGAFDDEIPVVDPATREALPQTTIRDPYTGEERPVVGVEVAFASAIATGKLARVLLGQWTMLGKLRKVPDTAVEFTGFAIPFDPIAGTFASDEPYVPTGTSRVRSVLLPSRYSHIGAPIMEHLPGQPSTRAWVNAWRPDGAPPPMPQDADVRNLELAADLWYSIRRHWCLEGQRRLTAGAPR